MEMWGYSCLVVKKVVEMQVSLKQNYKTASVCSQ